MAGVGGGERGWDDSARGSQIRAKRHWAWTQRTELPPPILTRARGLGLSKRRQVLMGWGEVKRGCSF